MYVIAPNFVFFLRTFPGQLPVFWYHTVEELLQLSTRENCVTRVTPLPIGLLCAYQQAVDYIASYQLKAVNENAENAVLDL